MWSRSAEVGEAVDEPTPTPARGLVWEEKWEGKARGDEVWVFEREERYVPSSTAREESRPAMEEEKAWRES